MDELQTELKETKNKLKTTEEELRVRGLKENQYVLPHGYPSSAKDYLSSLEQDKLALMQEESDIRNEILSLRENAPQQGISIIIH